MLRQSQILDQRGKPMAVAHTGASSTARELSSWFPPLDSADSATLPELDLLTRRNRDLTRNHGVADGAADTLVDNVVGTGLRLSAQPDWKTLGKTEEWAQDWSRDVENKWRTYAASRDVDAARQLNFPAMSRMIYRSSLGNGDAVAISHYLPRSGRKYATCFQLVESDRLSNPHGAADSARLRGGVSIDRFGGPTGYWIRKTHPGEAYTSMGMSQARREWRRIPARTRWGRLRVVHVLDPKRIGQHRGVPFLASVLSRFKMLDHYEMSELKASIVNAMVAAFIESPMDMESIRELFGDDFDTYAQKRSEHEVQLQGGAILPLFPGDKVAGFEPNRPNSAFGGFIENVLRHIGVAIGLPYELLMKDFSKTNYSSARASLLEAWRKFATSRQYISTCWATPVYVSWFEEAVDKGEIEAPDFYANWAAFTRCDWIGPGRGWVDPVKEAQAAKIRMKTLVSTLQRECAEQGLDWEEVLQQRAREKKAMEEHGLFDEDVLEILAGGKPGGGGDAGTEEERVGDGVPGVERERPDKE